MQVHEAERTPIYVNAKRPAPRHIIQKLSKIDNEKIHLNDILYDQVSYVDNIDLDFSELAPGPYVNANITEELDKISSQKGCYILETQNESKLGQKIAMYVIGDTYYFIRFFDNGTIMRVHSGTVQ